MGRVCQGAHGVYVMPDVSRNPEQAVPIENQDQPVTIRPATVADQVALAELNAVVQQMHHDIAPKWFKPPELAAAIDFFREALRSDALRTFVAEVDGVVRGYALARLQKQPETALTYGGLVVELDQISVDPGVSGPGTRATAHRPGEIFVSALTETRAFCSSKVALEDVPHGEG